MAKTKPDYREVGLALGRKAAGRPLLEGEPLVEQINFRLSSREADNLKAYCWRYDLSPSMVMRDALRILGISGF